MFYSKTINKKNLLWKNANEVREKQKASWILPRLYFLTLSLRMMHKKVERFNYRREEIQTQAKRVTL